MVGDHECGSIQGFRLQARYNLQEINNLFSHRVQSYASGIAQYSATARRAFITLDTFFGTQKDIFDLASDIEDTKDAFDLAQASGNLLDYAAAAAKAWVTAQAGYDTVKDIWDTFAGAEAAKDQKKLDIYEFFNIMKFDVVVKSPVFDFPSGLDSYQKAFDKVVGSGDIMVLKNCRVNSRTVDIQAQNVIVMEDLEIQGLDFEDFASKTEQQALKARQ
jgi:hypothetical protein